MKDFWQNQIELSECFSEADVQTKLIAPLLHFLGFSANQWRQGYENEKSSVDFIVGQEKDECFEPFFVIEAKSPKSNLSLYAHQLEYCLQQDIFKKCRYGVLTNGTELIIYEYSLDGRLNKLVEFSNIRNRSEQEKIFLILNKEIFIPSEDKTERAKIITIYNNKGGVGKTTLSINLAAALQEYGYRVLVIDLDAQANTTFGLGIYPPNTLDRNIVTLFNEYPRTSIEKLIWKNANGNGLDVVPSNIDLYQALHEFAKSGNSRKELFLKERLNSMQNNEYDFIFIDTPPSMDISFELAITAGDYLLVPSDLKPFSIYGLSHLLQGTKNRIKILGVAGNNVDLAVNLSKPINQIKQEYRLNVFDQIIHNRNCVAQCTGQGITIFQMEKQKRGNAASVAAAEFRSLARQLLYSIDGQATPQSISNLKYSLIGS